MNLSKYKRFYKFRKNNETIKKIKIGDLIKLIRNNERFYAKVDYIKGDICYLSVKNNLINNDFKVGDKIKINKRYIF